MARASIIQRKGIVSDLPEELSRQVFENDLLREIILDYFLHNSGCLSRKCLTVARRVHPSWLRSTTDIMRKRKQPVFVVNLNKENSSIDNEYIRTNGRKLLDSVMRCLKDRTPRYTYSLKVSADYFDPANCRGLSCCLANAGDKLVGLDITYPLGDIKFPSLEELKLPILQRLAIRLSGHRMESSPSRALGCNLSRFDFVRVLLDGAKELKELLMDGVIANNVKVGRGPFNVPESVNKICIDMPLKSSDLRKILSNNNLPNLKSLRLFATERPYSNEVIFGILDKFKDQLTTLDLTGRRIQRSVTATTNVRLPVMSTLESLWVGNQSWELEQDAGNLQEFLPALKEMKMTKTRRRMFTKWTENSVYPSVQSVGVSLVRSHHLTQMDVPVTPCLQKMQILHISYPNVVSLEINLYCQEMSGLKYIFMEMRNLNRLTILVKGHNPMLPANHWDSLLIGAPTAIIESLRSNPDYWPMFMPNDDNELPSIRKLTHLKELALIESLHPEVEGPPLISDMAFHFGFLRMENLTLLGLHGLFMPSEEVRTLWHTRKGENIKSFKPKSY